MNEAERLLQAQVQDRLNRLYLALEVCSAELFAQCADQGRAMKYVEQARKALAAEQCARAALSAAQEAPVQPAAQQEEWDIDAAVEKAWGRFQAALEQDEPLPPPSIHAAAHYGTWLGREAHRHDEPRASAFRNAARMLSVLETEVRRLHAELLAAQAQEAAPQPAQPLIAELEAELEKTKAIFAASCNHAAVMEMDRDARRYRWLRDGWLVCLPYEDHGLGPEYPCHEELDAAIDAAMKEQGNA